jgi:UDP:flavonoid glycosyltransferase YjiC (YdhE family)
MLVVPFAHDQFDNAARVRRLGVARVLFRKRYRAARVATELQRLLDDPNVAQRAESAGKKVRAENGASAAADALEMFLAKNRQRGQK